MPAGDHGRRLSLEFDGVFRDCLVALNGIFLGRNLSGYAPFSFDISDLANYGGRNVLLVRADATEHEGWFYEGAGIYRHVWLVKTDAGARAAVGHVRARRAVTGGAGDAHRRDAGRERERARRRVCRVRSTVADPGGRVVATAVDGAGAPGRVERARVHAAPDA